MLFSSFFSFPFFPSLVVAEVVVNKVLFEPKVVVVSIKTQYIDVFIIL